MSHRMLAYEYGDATSRRSFAAPHESAFGPPRRVLTSWWPHCSDFVAEL